MNILNRSKIMMKHYKNKITGELFGYASPDQDHLVTDDLVLLTDEELEELRNPTSTYEQLVEQAAFRKTQLLDIATVKIAPLQDAVDLDEATEDELSQLKEWKKFRVLVNRVDTSLTTEIEWPEMPE